jgi:hypothetical protein
MQGPYGLPRTIDVNSSTQYNASNSLGTLVPNAIISDRRNHAGRRQHSGQHGGTDYDR